MSTCPWLRDECICTTTGGRSREPQQWRFTNDWYYEDQRGTVFTGVLTDIPERGGRSSVYLGIVAEHDIHADSSEGCFSKGTLIWVRASEIELVTS